MAYGGIHTPTALSNYYTKAEATTKFVPQTADTYSPTITYYQGALAVYSGAVYRSLQSNNTGHLPDEVNSVWWALQSSVILTEAETIHYKTLIETTASNATATIASETALATQAKNEAITAKTAAQTAQTAAEGFAANASTSAANAAASALAASTSATNANTYKVDAQTAATAAALSETHAAGYATNASNSAAAASGYATNAADSAGLALTYKNEANDAKLLAQAAEANASTYADNSLANAGLSQRYAENPYNVEVIPATGQYSSLHYATVSQMVYDAVQAIKLSIDTTAVVPLWVSGSDYTAGTRAIDPVNYNMYICIVAINGGTTPPRDDITHWQQFASSNILDGGDANSTIATQIIDGGNANG